MEPLQTAMLEDLLSSPIWRPENSVNILGTAQRPPPPPPHFFAKNKNEQKIIEQKEVNGANLN